MTYPLKLHGPTAPAHCPVKAICALALSLALVVYIAFFAFPALAYYNFGSVTVSTGVSSLSVEAGKSTSTSVSVSPASDEQTLGCGMAKCPQVCESEGAVEAGYTCFDKNGQCTCAGKSYSTYYTDKSASSSDSSVATATVSGNTLQVTGKKTGTATITVKGSLRQWTDGEASVQVTVTAASSSSSSGSSSSGSGTSGSTSWGSGSSSSSGSGSGGSGSSSGSTPSGSGSGSGSGSTTTEGTSQDSGTSSGTVDSSAVIIPEAATETSSVDDALNLETVETVAGTVYTVESNSYLDMAEMLGKIAGTQDQVIVWSGPSSTDCDYSWTFVGSDVDAASENLGFDPTITISKMGTGDVSNIMDQARDGLVLDFAHSGALPGKATIYIKTTGTYEDGTTLSLFLFDDETGTFSLQQEGLTTVGGYVSFTIDHCSTWALSTDDLTAYTVQETYTPLARSTSENSPSATSETNIVPFVAAGIVALAVVAGIVAVLIVSRRKSAGEGDEDDSGEGDQPAGAGTNTGGTDEGDAAVEGLEDDQASKDTQDLGEAVGCDDGE